MTDAFEATEGDGISVDFFKILTLVRANMKMVGGIILTAMALALGVTMLQTPRYTAATTVQIDDQSAQVLGNGEDGATLDNGGSHDTDRFLQTQLDVLRSRAIAERVTRKLQLADDPKFFEAMVEHRPAENTPKQAIRERVSTILLVNFEANMRRNSRLATISFTSANPELSARIANAWANEFIQANLQRRYDSSSYAREFISGQLEEAKAKLEVSERDLNNYARRTGIIRQRAETAGGAVGQGSLTESSLQQLNSAANDAQAIRIAAEQRYRAISASNPMNSPEVLANGAITALLNDRARLQGDLQRERAKHLDDHPNVISLLDQQNVLDQQIHRLAENIRSSVRLQYEAALRSEQQLKSQVSGLKGSTMAEQDLSVQYNLLARDAATNRALYDSLLQRYKELQAAAGITASNISIIDLAETPKVRSSPSLVRNMLLAVLVGVAIAAGILIVSYQFDDAVRVPEDIEAKLNLPLLGVIPKTQSGDLMAALRDPKSAVSEGYASLRGALMHSTIDGLPKTLLITSSQPSEGKSTTSASLAIGFAKLGYKAMLIDVDLRRPALHAVFKIKNEIGVTSVLTGQHTIDEVTQNTDLGGLTIITSGPIPPSPTELLGSTRMLEMMRELKNTYDVVIFDAPPVLGLADAIILSPIVDGVVMIVQSARGRRGSLRTSLRRLRSVRPNIIGAVLSMFDASSVGNRYSEYYGYEYYSYGEK